jgi:cytochrome c biogenesis protein CcmG/thiol:disulfide interchange protein DsbE
METYSLIHVTRLWRGLLAAILVVAVLPVQSLATAGQECAGTWWVAPSQLAVGESMPEFGFATCTGEELTTASLEDKPLLINFWATWCPPCVRELPNFAELHEKFGDEVNILGVSVDQHPEFVKKFLDKNELPYMLAWDSEGIAADLGFRSIPVTVAVDADGNVASVHQGYASADDLAELVAGAQDLPVDAGDSGQQ